MDNSSPDSRQTTSREGLHSQRRTLSLPLEESISSELREGICTGRVRPEQKLAICAGAVSLPPDERVELLAVLATDSDAAIADRARNVALSQPLAAFLTAMARPDVDPRLLAYCANNLLDQPGIADALARSSACPNPLTTRVASHLTSDGIQSLLENLVVLTSEPHLIAALAQSKAATPSQREMLHDLQKGVMSPKELAELEELGEAAEPDAVKRKTLMQKLAFMTVVQRLTLALKGGREERMLLIRDPNKLVQKSVLQSPRLTETEVENFAAMANLSTEILRAISLNRLFMKNYIVVRNLVMNPKTPIDVSLHLFPRLNATDLVKLTNNKNVPDTLRSMAQKLQRKRKQGGPG